MKKKVLIVDDSAFVRQTLKNLLTSHEDIEVVGTAVNGVDAIEKVLRFNPDVILLDLEMPLMDGFSFMRWLMMERPTPVIIVSSYSDRDTVFRALQAGAVDFIGKPTRKASAVIENIEKELLFKLKAIDSRVVEKLKDREETPTTATSESFIKPTGRYQVLAIGASTGGPQAIETILKGLPLLGIPVLITQHMPQPFTGAFAERLNRILLWDVREAKHGDHLRANTVYICPGGRHMAVENKGENTVIKLLKPSPEDKYVPSVDILMRSVGEVFKNRAIGVILTGMGKDGLKGMEVIKKAGGFTVAESEETAIVYGMPKAVIKAGLAEAVPLFRISSVLAMAICGKEVS
ncbi:MAG: chemotaxis response regulator protein-glutamate methylesterase [Nitrospirae bacterium]|nr:MAG: chemotaxis response regulator protein-glutamate methylesterase [Nitrospirota bacterium]